MKRFTDDHFLAKASGRLAQVTLHLKPPQVWPFAARAAYQTLSARAGARRMTFTRASGPP